MRISHRHRFIFIHVPKTAGSSVGAALEPYSVRGRDLGFGNHPSARKVRRRRWPFYPLYFKFAFVRNPWALEVSFYQYFRRIGEPSAAGTFSEWVEIRHAEFSRKGKTSRQIRQLTDRGGNLIVDFVGRVERIDTDFSFICGRIGFDRPLALPRINRSTFTPWRDFYEPEGLRDRVAEYVSDDVAMLGYVFDQDHPVGDGPLLSSRSDTTKHLSPAAA